MYVYFIGAVSMEIYSRSKKSHYLKKSQMRTKIFIISKRILFLKAIHNSVEDYVNYNCFFLYKIRTYRVSGKKGTL